MGPLWAPPCRILLSREPWSIYYGYKVCEEHADAFSVLLPQHASSTVTQQETNHTLLQPCLPDHSTVFAKLKTTRRKQVNSALTLYAVLHQWIKPAGFRRFLLEFSVKCPPLCSSFVLHFWADVWGGGLVKSEDKKYRGWVLSNASELLFMTACVCVTLNISELCRLHGEYDGVWRCELDF